MFQRGTSNEYPQHVFGEIEEKNYLNILSYLELQYSSGGFSKSPPAGGEWIRVERIKF